jgi:hypothetical protein
VIKLQSPSLPPAELVLYDGGALASSISPKVLQSATFPIDRPTAGDLKQFLSEVARTKTDPAQGLFWRLSVENLGLQSVTLASWTLRLEGQPVTDVHGVVTDGTSPLPGVRVALDGVPFSLYSDLTDADGRFVISRVPLLPVNFSGIRPGYEPVDAANPGLSATFTRPFVGLDGLTFSALESQLIGRFNPMAGAPAALAGVAGFGFGTAEAPFEIQLQPAADGTPTIAAGPLATAAGTTVEFFAIDPAVTARWEFGDGTTADGSFATHAYEQAGVYRALLFSPADSAEPQDMVEVLIRPAPGRAPARPSELGGEPTGLDPVTANAPYAAHAFQPFLIGAGVLPASQVGLDPETGADLYITDLTPQTSFENGETNAQGAAYVSALPLQMAYATSMDLDLEPRVSPPGSSQPFGADGFTPLFSSGFDPSINANSQGFREEDFNYAHLASLWSNTRSSDGANEFPQDAQSGLILWGNTLVVPHINYSLQTFEAADGADYTFAAEDETFHPHTGTTTLTDLATHRTVRHFQVACSIGAPILTAPVSPTSVAPAKIRRSQPQNPLEDPLKPAPAPVGRNLYFQLHTGALGAQ